MPMFELICMAGIPISGGERNSSINALNPAMVILEFLTCAVSYRRMQPLTVAGAINEFLNKRVERVFPHG